MEVQFFGVNDDGDGEEGFFPVLALLLYGFSVVAILIAGSKFAFVDIGNVCVTAIVAASGEDERLRRRRRACCVLESKCDCCVCGEKHGAFSASI